MTQDEYLEQIDQITMEYNERKRQAARQFALANNPVSVGDVVSDGLRKILVEKISVWLGYGLPECRYSGTLLKKNGDKLKSGKKGIVYQQSIVSHIKGGD